MQIKNLTAKDLASLIETDEDRAKGVKLYRVIENWAGRRASMPGADRAVAIAKALGVSVEFMVNGKDDSKNYSEIRLLTLAKKYRDIIEWLEILDPLTLNNVRTTVKALAGSLDRNELMVSDQTAGCGNNEK